jgi:uncharacterized damage-inducible protein DinB
MAKAVPLDVERELLHAFRQSGLVSEYLVSVLPVDLWQAAPACGRGRTIAAMVAHLQSVRRMFAKVGGAQLPSLDRKTSTPAQAKKALRQSTEELARLFESAFAARKPRVKGMPRRAVNMLIYLIQHDAHHRGQICSLARDLGHELSRDDIMRIWGWKALPPM